MSEALKIDTSAFKSSMEKIAKNVNTNTVLYANKLGKEFVSTAKSTAPWTDRKGNARRGFSAEVQGETGMVTIVMQGEAKNYKRGQNSTADYMEYLEFDHDGKYATLYPTVSVIAKEVKSRFGEAALLGKTDVKIRRDKANARARARRNRH